MQGKPKMKFSNMIKKVALVLLLPVSITNLPADTNSSAIDTEQASAPAASSPTSNDPSSANPVLIQCRTFAENLELIIGMIFNIKSGQGKRLVDAVTPILSYCDTIKKLPDTASPAQILQACATLNEGTQNLIQLLEKGADQVQELAAVPALNDLATDTDIAQAYMQVDGNFNQLVAKVEEAYQDVWRNLRMHVNNQLNKIDKILQDININVSNNESIVGKEEIKKEIMGLRTELRQIQKELSMASTNPQAVLSVYQVNKAFIAYLQECQKYKFRKWAVTDLVKELKRTPDANENQTLDELLYEMARTNASLDKLEKDAEKVDLTVVNHAARLVGDYVVDPIQRYNLALWGAAAVATFGLATYAAYYFDEKFFTDPNCLFRRIFKFRNHQRGKMTQIPPKEYFDDLLENLPLTPEQFEEALKAKNQNPAATRKDYMDAMKKVRMWELVLNQAKRAAGPSAVAPIDDIEEFIYENKSGTAAIGLSLIGLATFSYYQIWKTYSKTWSEKLYIWFTRLKGGSYAKTAEKFDEILPTITFDDVIGLEHEKSLIYPHLKYIKDPESWDANGRTPPTGILLTGDTRTGKTFFAKAICGELHKQNPEKALKFLSIDAHDIKAEGIATWMKVAKMLAPCVLFIDEIDLLNLQRTGDRTLLSDFLKEMSGIADKDPKKQVIVIGTTNKPENIDTAMIQSGRLALVIPFSYPNLKDRINFIEKRFEKFAIDPKAFDIDVERLAYETNGKSFEDLKLMLDTAFIRTDIKGEAISQEHLEWALDTQLRKVIKEDTKDVTIDEKHAIAAHFAGEVLSHFLLQLHEKIAKVTIHQIVVKAKEEAVADVYKSDHKKQAHVEQGAVFTYLEHDTYDIKTADELEKKAKTYIGARIAERIITKTTSTVLGSKKNAAFNLIKTVIADGIDLKSLSKEGQNKISDETLAKLKEFEKEMEQLLLQHKDTLIALTNELQEKQMLTFSQVKKIIDSVEGTGSTAPAPLESTAAAA
jgi:cell division protease FtsH